MGEVVQLRRTVPWQDPAMADFYLPQFREIYLNPEATRLLLEKRCSFGGNRRAGWRWGPAYCLFKMTGELRSDGPPAVSDWVRAVEAAAHEQLAIYNGRSHRTCRPVWYSEPRHRTIANMSFDKVQLRLHGETYYELSKGHKVVKGEVITWV